MGDVVNHPDDEQLEREYVISQTFASEEDAFLFYEAYAKDKGFSERKSTTKKADGVVTSRTFVCSREGWRCKNMADRSRKPRNITRNGCMAQLVVKVDNGTGHWNVSTFIAQHNHDLLKPYQTCFHREHHHVTTAHKHSSSWGDFILKYMMHWDQSLTTVKSDFAKDFLPADHASYDNIDD
ncbi:hypothetical protein EJB05_14462 [Eragrostis curvula]|uniref:FAR1 domain-containing protein n=1 Tax=Eragrostis curvula TaxID=38414 RepID=A0A5J9VZD8_9POAL|nr:hypothetical protein EJB05_14462 [Eragrostis curvula]